MYIQKVALCKKGTKQIKVYKKREKQKNKEGNKLQRRRADIRYVYIALLAMRGLGGDIDLISGAELGKSVFSLCRRISDLDGISFRRNC